MVFGAVSPIQMLRVRTCAAILRRAGGRGHVGTSEDNVYYTLACNGHGLAQAPYVGSLIADLIVDVHQYLITERIPTPRFISSNPSLMSSRSMTRVMSESRSMRLFM